MRVLWALLAVVLSLGWSSASAASLKLVFTGGVNPGTTTACTAASTRCLYRNVVFDQTAGAALAANNPYQRDAVVTRAELVNASLTAFDDDTNATAGNNAQYFSPIVSRLNQNNTTQKDGYARFSFTFYTTGQTNPTVTKALDGGVFISALDIDGNGAGSTSALNEFVTLFNPTHEAAGNELGQVTPPIPSTGTKTYRNTSNAVGNGISTANTLKVSIYQDRPITFDYVVGSTYVGSATAPTCASNTTSCNRLGAISFDRLDALPLVAVVDGYKSVRLTTDTNGDGIVNPGDRLTYTVTYVNTGNAPANAFQITDLLPAGVAITNAGAQTVRLNGVVTAAARNANYTGTGANTGLLAANQVLAANGTVSVDLPVTVANTATGTVSNQTTASATGLTVPSSDAADTSTTFPPAVVGATGWAAIPAGSVGQTQTAALDQTAFTVVSQADLSVIKTGPATAAAGTQISYLLTITNAGPSSADGATFSDNVPSGLTGVTAACQNPAGGVSGCSLTVGSGNNVTGSIATLPNGGKVEVLIRGTIPPGATEAFSNTASVKVPTGVTDPTSTAGTNTSGTVTTTLTKIADLSVTKTDGLTSVVSGQTVTYTIVVANAGPSTTTASFADKTFSGVTLSNWTCTPTTGTATCPTGLPTSGGYSEDLLNLPASSSLTFRVTGRVTATSGTASNTATLTPASGTTDPTPSPSVTDMTTVEAAVVRARLTKTVQNITPNFISAVGTRADGLPGQTLEYCIAFSNEGNVSLPNFSVRDGVPANTTYIPNSAAVTPAASFPGARTTFDSATTTWNDGTTNRTVNGVVTANVGTLAAGAQGQLCFRATIR